MGSIDVFSSGLNDEEHTESMISKNSIRALPSDVFKMKQSEVRSIVTECIENAAQSKQLINNDHIQKVHNEYEGKTSDMQKCLSFYEQQLMMYSGGRIYSEKSGNS